VVGLVRNFFLKPLSNWKIFVEGGLVHFSRAACGFKRQKLCNFKQKLCNFAHLESFFSKSSSKLKQFSNFWSEPHFLMSTPLPLASKKVEWVENWRSVVTWLLSSACYCSEYLIKNKYLLANLVSISTNNATKIGWPSKFYENLGQFYKFCKNPRKWRKAWKITKSLLKKNPGHRTKIFLKNSRTA